ANLMEIACDLAIDASLDKGVEVDIDEEIIMDALHELQPTTAEWLSTASNYARYANDSGQYNDILKFIDKYGRR
ncbi:MAG: ATP-binding protein, partial [Pseudomonadota bacterium]